MQGPLPDSWGSLSSLVTLQLYNGLVMGTLPDAWGSLGNLTSLQLQNNQLNGGCWLLWPRREVVLCRPPVTCTSTWVV